MSEPVKIALGYIISFVYMTVVMLAGELLHKKFGVGQELARKISHILSSACWVICWYFTGATYHTVIINAVALVLVAATVFSGKLDYADKADASKSMGLVYFCLSTLIVMSITVFAAPELFVATGIAYYALALGDGLAPIVAKHIFGKHNIKVFGEKTLAGTVTVFAVSSLVALGFCAWFGLKLDAMFIVSTGALACTAELMGKKGADNLLIDFAVFGYTALFVYGKLPTAFEAAIIICAPLFVIDSLAGSLTPAANIISYCYFTVSVYLLGFVFFLPAIVLFGAEAIISRITSKLYNARVDAEPEKRARNAWQILANGGAVFLLSVLYYFLDELPLLFAALAVFTEEFADSVASDIGRLAKKPPIDILTFKRLRSGISGGVSLLGTLSATVCAAAGAGLCFAFVPFDYRAFLIICGVAIFGVMADSVFGSAVQALYRCDVCGTDTERETHCGADTRLVKGVRCINNTAVNLLSGIVTATAAIILLFTCL